jgi:hypothetical protein
VQEARGFWRAAKDSGAFVEDDDPGAETVVEHVGKTGRLAGVWCLQ